MSADPVVFDWRNPDYLRVFQERTERLRRLRSNPAALEAIKLYYRDNPAQFINDWGTTFDPRNPERGLPSIIPFVLFPRQVEFVEYVIERWRDQEPGLIEKSRDVGASWLAMALACTLCLFNRGIAVGVGSRKEELVDRSGDPSSLFYKARMFMRHLPVEFRGNWDERRHGSHMRLVFDETGSAIVGEAGDQIGRGGRSSLFFVDEAAFLERPALIEASLSATTNCRIDMSSVNGPANAFAQKRFSGKIKVFTFRWQDDPRKDDAWYKKKVDELDPVTVAAEIDLSYHASVEGQLIPVTWINAAVGAHEKLKIEPTGLRRGALDIADEGKDLCAFAGRHGILLEFIKSWSGKGGDIYGSVVRAFNLCEELQYDGFHYDADGLGAGVRGDARRINEDRSASGKRGIRDEPFRGSGAVWNPNGQMVPQRFNKDFFLNLKAQSWWALRQRFQNTYRAVVEQLPYSADDIISINPRIGELSQLIMELSQPTYSLNSVGKVVIDKVPDGARSPNLADAVMIAFHPIVPPKVWSQRELQDLYLRHFTR